MFHLTCFLMRIIKWHFSSAAFIEKNAERVPMASTNNNNSNDDDNNDDLKNNNTNNDDNDRLNGSGNNNDNGKVMVMIAFCYCSPRVESAARPATPTPRQPMSRSRPAAHSAARYSLILPTPPHTPHTWASPHLHYHQHPFKGLLM